MQYKRTSRIRQHDSVMVRHYRYANSMYLPAFHLSYAFDNHLGVAILRISKGFDFSDHMKCFDEPLNLNGVVGSYTQTSVLHL